MWRVFGILAVLFAALLTQPLIQCDLGDDAYAACVLDETGRSVEKASNAMANLGPSLNAAMPRFPSRGR